MPRSTWLMSPLLTSERTARSSSEYPRPILDLRISLPIAVMWDWISDSRTDSFDHLFAAATQRPGATSAERQAAA
jgi:hypothetical protein